MRSLLLSLVVFSAYATPVFALSPSDLKPPMTSEESSFYDKIKGDPASAQGFLATREYVRTARAVVTGSLPPLSYPSDKPPGFSAKYLLAEDPSILNKALGMYLAAKSGRSVPPTPPDPILSPSDLKPPMTKEERTYYDSIKADAPAEQSFLTTRNHVRKARAVVNGSLSALSFPDQPLGYSGKYLLSGESKLVRKAVDMHSTASLKANPEKLLNLQ